MMPHARNPSRGVELADEIQQLIESVVADMKVSCRSHVNRPAGSPIPELDMSLTPEQGDASPLQVHTDPEGAIITLEFGRDSRIEIATTGWRQTDLPGYRDEVELLCRSVLAGNILERLWYRDGSILRSEAVLETARGPITTRHVSSVRGSSKGGREVVMRYVPYPRH